MISKILKIAPRASGRFVGGHGRGRPPASTWHQGRRVSSGKRVAWLAGFAVCWNDAIEMLGCDGLIDGGFS